MKVKINNKQQWLLKLLVLIILNLNLSLNLFSQGVGINTSGLPSDASAMLDVSSTSQGLLIPRLTTIQRDAIISPALSLLIFNTTTNCFEAYVNGAWYSVSCPPLCTTPVAPASGTNTPSLSQIVWNWTTVTGATGYKYGTTSAYTSATNAGTSITYTQTGLNCNSAFTLFVWAYNSCGNSSYTVLTQSTSSCICPVSTCGSQVWMTTNMNYGTRITGGQNQNPGQKWCYNDVESNCTIYGGMYEWTAVMNISPTYLLNTSTYYGTADEICNPCGPTTGHNGVKGICPYGYHIPSDCEFSQYEYCLESTISPTGNTPLSDFQTINLNYRGSNSSAGPGAKMKATSSNNPPWDGTNISGFNALPTGYYSNGWGNNLGTLSYYWTSTEHPTMPQGLSVMHCLFSGRGDIYRQMESSKSNGFPLRCLKD
jgi:uncharacterized protein (TIGR02145 family)